MGCTSSAASMGPVNSKATEHQREMKLDKEYIEEDIQSLKSEEESEKSGTKVLPTCDTLAEPIYLDSSNKIMIDTSNLDLDKDLYESHDTVLNEENDVQTEEKLYSLEDVVEKVVELLVADSTLNGAQEQNATESELSTENGTKSERSNDLSKVVDKPNTNSELDNEEITDQLSENGDEIEADMASPSQSTSSRATRWEALADIAAELPPSLAVDPLTGQIYALSK